MRIFVDFFRVPEKPFVIRYSNDNGSTVHTEAADREELEDVFDWAQNHGYDKVEFSDEATKAMIEGV